MTDTAKVPNVYYTCSQYNDPTVNSTAVNATVDNKLLYPLVKDSGNYQIGLQKAKIPLDTIPLTPYNIPLKQYELTLRQGNIEASAYLRQLNAQNENFAWNCTPSGIVSKYSYSPTSGVLTLITTADISNIVNTVAFFLVDDYQNAYVASGQGAGSLVNTLYVINLGTLNVLATLEFTQIQGLDLDRGQKLYVADEAPGGSVIQIYSNRNTASTVILTNVYTIREDFDGNVLTDIRTICADQTLLVGYDVNKFTLYSVDNFLPIQGFTEVSITNMGQASAILSSGTGNFCVTDDGNINNLFVGTKADNLNYNMITNTAYSSPGTWLPQSKFAFTNTNMFGVGAVGSVSTGLYSVAYDSSTGQTSGIPVEVSGDTNYTNCVLYADRSQSGVLYTSSSGNLDALNLDNLQNNTLSTIDNDFTIGGVVPDSCDYQSSTNKIIAIDNSTKALHITSQPIYPKNFVMGTNVSGTSPLVSIQRYATGWNKDDESNTSTVIANGVFNQLASGTLVDGYQAEDGSLYFLQNITGTGWVVRHYSINGTIIGTITLPAQPVYFGISHILGDYFAVMDINGDVLIYTQAGTLTETIPTAVGATPTPQCYICGGHDIVNGISCIFLSNGTSFYVYTSTAIDGTGYALATSTNVFTPDGYATPMYMYGGLFYGSLTGLPTLYMVTSGSNASPGISSSQSIFQVSFLDGTYSAIDFTNTVLFQNTITPSEVNSPLSAGFNIGEMYVMNSAIEVWNGNVQVFNVTTKAPTSSMTVLSDTVLANSTTSFFAVQLGGASEYYTWQPIVSTGATSFSSLAVGRKNPNNLYVLDASGNAWKGTLSGLTIAFSAYTAINGEPYTSISLTPDVSEYDSTVYCYTISNQSLVGSKYYGASQVPAIAKNDVTSQFIVSVSNTKYDILTASEFNLVASTPLANAFFVFAKNGEDVDAGYANIFSFQVLIDSINSAFSEAYTRLKSAGGTLAEAPTIELSQSGYWTLNYSSDYTTRGNGILFNQVLLQIVRFYSQADSVDTGFFILKLPAGSTTTTQIGKSAYLFNKLDKILFQSQTIFVSGSFVGNNSQNQVITDVDVPTESYLDNTGQQLIYAPNFLRMFQIASNNAIDRIQLNLLYSLTDGSEYQLTINPDQSWSTLLDFVKKF